MEELIPIFLFMCIAGVLILRPITKKLGLLVEAVAKERMAGVRPVTSTFDDGQIEQVATALDRLNNRLERMEDRMTFMERLIEDQPRRRLTG